MSQVVGTTKYGLSHNLWIVSQMVVPLFKVVPQSMHRWFVPQFMDCVSNGLCHYLKLCHNLCIDGLCHNLWIVSQMVCATIHGLCLKWLKPQNQYLHLNRMTLQTTRIATTISGLYVSGGARWQHERVQTDIGVHRERERLQLSRLLETLCHQCH